MDNCKLIFTSMSSSTYMDQDEFGTPIDITKYRGVTGSLLYVLFINRVHRNITSLLLKGS